MTTIGQVLRQGAQQLENSSSAYFDAQLLLAHILECELTTLFIHSQRQLKPAQQTAFKQLIKRRQHGEPVAYIVGHCGFWTLELEVSPAVLIPRADTETLVEATLNKRPLKNLSVADLGTGSGAVALALAYERPSWKICATDASPQALACAKTNAEHLNIENIDFIHSYWFDQLEGQHFDVIVSNPPYIADQDPHLADLSFEPIQALTANEQGLADIKIIIQAAPAHLKPDGWLLLEHGYQQGAAVRRLLADIGFKDIQTLQDLGANDRVSCGHL